MFNNLTRTWVPKAHKMQQQQSSVHHDTVEVSSVKQHSELTSLCLQLTTASITARPDTDC